MKKLMTALIFVAVLFSALPVSSTTAAPLALPQCTIAKWNPGGVSGGCTCYVAEKIKAATKLDIPWRGNAGEWWNNSKNTNWVRSAEEPRKGSIAAFSYGHVAYVDEVKLNSKTEKVVKSVPYTRQVNLFWFTLAMPSTAKQYKVTETYTVYVSQRDYNRIKKNDNSVRKSNWTATFERYYWSDSKLGTVIPFNQVPEKLPKNKWTTPRGSRYMSGSNGLQGYIYHP